MIFVPGSFTNSSLIPVFDSMTLGRLQQEALDEPLQRAEDVEPAITGALSVQGGDLDSVGMLKHAVGHESLQELPSPISPLSSASEGESPLARLGSNAAAECEDASEFVVRRPSAGKFLNLDILYVKRVLDEEISSPGSPSSPDRQTGPSTALISQVEAGRQGSESKSHQDHQSEEGVVLRSLP
jgi:hypothetical protein